MNMRAIAILLLPFATQAAAFGQEPLLDSFPVLPGNAPPLPTFQKHSFTLRDVYHHGVERYPALHRKVHVDPAYVSQYMKDAVHMNSLQIVSHSILIQRLVDRDRQDIDLLLDDELTSERRTASAPSWALDHVAGPNVTDKETVLSFARMAANAYEFEPFLGDWRDVGSGFNYSEDFGWEKDGLRGHVFADTTNSTIVISMKGTSLWLLSKTDTSTNDRFNDNLLASCCCGQGEHYGWKSVCSCKTSAYTCNATCLDLEVHEKSRYYWAAREMYHNITSHYPNAKVWLTGHSLGGVVASLLGLTYGLPTITFETFPDALAAGRLGLPTPPGYKTGRHQDRTDTGIYHFGQTADPVFMGTCNTAASSCTIAGYAFQSQCHTGHRCVYDTVGDLGWRVNIENHRILSVIDDVLEPYDTVPSCVVDSDCVDCYEWNFVVSNGTESSSSISSTRTLSQPSTTTCTSPGWWGCRDPTTTAEKHVKVTMTHSEPQQTNGMVDKLL